MEETLTLIEKTAFLKSIPILSTIPTEPLAEIAGRATEIRSEPGEILFRAGDVDRGSYIVVDGLLQLRRGAAVVRILQAGMAFGELWLSEGQPHQYEMISIEHSHVLNVTREDVFEAMQEYPEFGVGMVRAFALRVHELTSRVLDLERVVARLHRALDDAGVELPDLPETIIEPSKESMPFISPTNTLWRGIPRQELTSRPDPGTKE